MNMERVKGEINFQSVVSVIILAVVIWVGASIQSHTARLSEISSDVAVLKNIVNSQAHELTDLKAEQLAQSIIIAQIGWDVGGRRRFGLPPPNEPPKQKSP